MFLLGMALVNTLPGYSYSLKWLQIQNGLMVEDAKVTVDYGRTVTFTARIETALPIKQASILLRGMSEELPRLESLPVEPDGRVKFVHDSAHNPLPPFEKVWISIQATLEDGKTYSGEPLSFDYYDNRFPWLVTSRDNLNLHWYAGEDSFGEQALNAAASGLDAIRGFLPISLSEPIQIYVYSNPLDLENALELGGEEWAAGHTPAWIGAILVAIEPGPQQTFEMNTEIPHELAHWILFRALDEGYDRQPAWLMEGMASMAELQPNPDQIAALQVAHQAGSLLPFRDLCVSFPAQAGNAFLARAQSHSFVTYIRKTYGDGGLLRLTEAHRNRDALDEAGCELGPIKALGTPLGQLEQRWRETALVQNSPSAAVRNLAPFIAVLALVIIVPLWGAIELVRERRKHGRQFK